MSHGEYEKILHDLNCFIPWDVGNYGIIMYEGHAGFLVAKVGYLRTVSPSAPKGEPISQTPNPKPQVRTVREVNPKGASTS